MTRGRRPEGAIQLAIRIAEKRGEVQLFRLGPGTICTFVIYCAGLVAHVRIKRMRHLRCSLQWLEREVADGLAGLRMIASSHATSRELWLCSPKGNFRFFRVLDDSLAELDRDGQLLPAQAPGKKQRAAPSAPAPAEGPRRGPEVLEPAAHLAGSAPSYFAGTPDPAGIHGVSVGEKTIPDHEVGGTP